MDNKKFIIVSGPSGVGKTTVINHLLRRNEKLEHLITYTTRAKRQKNKEYKDEYLFISKKEFEKLIIKNHFIEWEEVYGNYYGKSTDELKKIWRKNKIAIATIDPFSLNKPEFDKPFMIKIFLTAKKENIIQRLKSRNLPETRFEKRKNMIERELKMTENADFVVENEQSHIDRTVERCEKIIFSKT